MSQIGNSGRLAPRTWPITQQHSVRLDDALEYLFCLGYIHPPARRAVPRESYHAEHVQDEWYPLTASRGMGVGTRGPLSRLNSSQASTRANVVATMMEVFFLSPCYLN